VLTPNLIAHWHPLLIFFLYSLRGLGMKFG
jgi:hypothetical protein